MENISINLGEDQYNDLITIISNISIAGVYGKYLSYKPQNTTIEESPKKYWKWAIGCVQRDIKKRERLNWRKFIKFGKDRTKYVKLYVRKLNAFWLPQLNKQELEGLFLWYICFFFATHILQNFLDFSHNFFVFSIAFFCCLLFLCVFCFLTNENSIEQIGVRV